MLTSRTADWFARRRSGRWSEADEASFASWLRSDPANAEEWAKYEQTWSRLEAVRDHPGVLALREAARQRLQRRVASRIQWRVAGAFAAVIAIGSSLYWRAEISPRAAAPLATTSGMPVPRGTAPALVQDAATNVGQRLVVRLNDGSSVTLNTASAIHADESSTERRVTLVRGEAFFDVAKDRTRPFVVTVGSHRVVAVGTAFAVRLQERQVRVTLVEGKVRVLATPADATGAGSPAAVTLDAGSQLIARDDGSEHVQRLDAERATSWRSGKLVFDGERLSEVVDEMNRYSAEKLVVANPAVGSRRVSGVFESGGGPAFAKALEAYGIARASQVSATTIVLEAPGRD